MTGVGGVMLVMMCAVCVPTGVVPPAVGGAHGGESDLAPAASVAAGVGPAASAAEQLVTAGEAPDARAEIAIDYALHQLGVPYVWGGDGPASGEGGFDCSGLTDASYAAAGIELPRTAQAQFDAGPHVPVGERPLPGDLVFYGDAEHVHHVGMYLGDGLMVNAPTFGRPVQIAHYRYAGDDYLGATRPAAAPGSLRTGWWPVVTVPWTPVRLAPSFTFGTRTVAPSTTHRPTEVGSRPRDRAPSAALPATMPTSPASPPPTPAAPPTDAADSPRVSSSVGAPPKPVEPDSATGQGAAPSPSLPPEDPGEARSTAIEPGSAAGAQPAAPAEPRRTPGRISPVPEPSSVAPPTVPGMPTHTSVLLLCAGSRSTDDWTIRLCPQPDLGRAAASAAAGLR